VQRLRARALALRPRGAALTPASRSRNDWGIERLGDPAAAALTFTLGHDDPLEEAERIALRALGAMLADPLRAQLDDRELTAEERRAFDGLVRHHLARQLDRVRDLAERYGEGPALRKKRKHLQGGALSDRNDPSWRLPEEARRDGDALTKQGRLREEHLGGREQRARQLAKAQGIVGRLRNRPETFVAEVDRARYDYAQAARRSPIPIPSGRVTNGRGLTSPGAVTSAAPRNWRRSSRPPRREVGGERGGGQLGQEAESRRRGPLQPARSARCPPRSARPPQRRAGRPAPRHPTRPLPRLPRWRRT
jgi:hypothetical protein